MPRDLSTVVDIVLACQDIEEFVGGLSKRQFLARKLVYLAVIRQVEVIGEAVKRLSDSFRAAHSDIPWRSISGMRDRLIHHYDQVDLEKVWSVATVDVPELRERLQPLMPLGSEPKSS